MFIEGGVLNLKLIRSPKTLLGLIEPPIGRSLKEA